MVCPACRRDWTHNPWVAMHQIVEGVPNLLDQRVEETYPKYALMETCAARRTFICFALSNGIPPQVVMKWTGHSDYKAMRPYIAEKTKSDAMKLIDGAW